MSKKIYKYLVMLLLFSSHLLIAQKKTSTSIVVIAPQNTFITTGELKKLTRKYERKKLSEDDKKKIKIENNGLEFKSQKEIEFLENTNFFKYFTYSLSIFLDYKLFANNQEALVYPIAKKHNSSLNTLKDISQNEKANWLVDIQSFKIYKKENSLKAQISYQLFNKQENKFMFSDVIDIEDKNYGFEFSCKEGTIDCIINNSVKKMSQKILLFIGKEGNGTD